MHVEAKHKALMDLFASCGFELRAVGGYVRDRLLGIEPKDVDFCTNATPQEMIVLARNNGIRWQPTGIDHGTITFVIDGEGYEITTLRVDVETDGRHAVVEFTTDFEADAARRDFTINAMSMDSDGVVYDYFGGQQDLKRNVIRFVGNAEERIREDYLRVLRYFRFTSRYDGMMDSTVVVFNQQWVWDGLKTVSKERVWAEFQKLLVGPGRGKVMFTMFASGIAQAVGLTQPTTGSAKWNKFGTVSDPISLLVPFVADAEAFAKDWRLSNADADKLCWMTQADAVLDGVHMFQNDRYNWIEDHLVHGTPRDWIVSIVRMHYSEDTAEYAETWPVPVFPVTGQDLLDAGMKPGPAIGAKLKEMKTRWVESRFKMNQKNLMEI